MRRQVRRRILRASLAFAGLGLLAGCGDTLKIRRIGFLAVGTREGRAPLIEGLRQGLQELGYVEGKNIVVEYRFSEGKDERLPELAQELIALKLELIVASGTPASFAAAKATRTVPIVMGGIAADPVETGLVASLARPGGNVTGMSLISSQLSGKRLELFKTMLPGLSRVAVFWNPTNPTYAKVMEELEEGARTLGLRLQRVEVRVPEDFEGAFTAAAREQAGALIVPGDPLTTNRPKVIADLAAKSRLPTMMEFREFVEAGGLMSYGANLLDSYRRAATYVDKILKGAKPADLPMQQPMKLDLFVNLKTAAGIGITIPQSILTRADKVIE